jgi:VanZ family protein
MPESPAPMPFPYCDKVYHILEYAVLGFLLLRALSYSKASLAGVDLRLVAFLLAALYGVTDEIHQYFVPTRHLEALDIISNSIGAYLGQIFFKIKN